VGFPAVLAETMIANVIIEEGLLAAYFASAIMGLDVIW
jgi:hypothetical protein